MNLEVYRRILADEAVTFPLPGRALWRLTGPDALRYLNGQVTADISPLAEGQGCYAAVCTAKGRMEGDLFIARRGADFYLDAVPILHESLGLRLEKYLVADDAALEDLSDLWHLNHVFGTAQPPLPDDGFIVPRTRFGLPGHDIWSPNPPPTGESAEPEVVETIRLEQGIPAWDAELTPTTLPPEAGPRLLAAISYTKGCYVGQETIARLKSVGHVNRTLVFLRSESSAFPGAAAKLAQGEKEAGVITSAGYSPRLERGIALGYIQRALAKEGNELKAGELKLTVAAPLAAKDL
jgi:folate-binding protein YgfZ